MTPTEKHRQTAVFIASYETELSVGRYKKLADKIARALAEAERDGMKRASQALLEVSFHDERDGGLAYDAVAALFLSQAGEA